MRTSVVRSIVTRERIEHVGLTVNQLALDIIEQVSSHDLRGKGASHGALFVYKRYVSEHIEQIVVSQCTMKACFSSVADNLCLITGTHTSAVEHLFCCLS